MAWNLMESEGDWTEKKHRATYMLDSADDISDPPDEAAGLAPGSVCYTADLAEIWQLNSSNEWVQTGTGATVDNISSGGNSGNEGLPADGPGVDPDPNAPITEDPEAGDGGSSGTGGGDPDPDIPIVEDPGGDETGGGSSGTDPVIPEVEADP